MHLFEDARSQLVKAMSDGAGRLLPGARVVQLGDLGGYKHKPGATLATTTAAPSTCSLLGPVSSLVRDHTTWSSGAGG